MSTIDRQRFGFPQEDWDRARDEMTRILERCAREGRVIAYSDLVDRVQTIKLQANDYALAAMLGEISQESDAQGRGMLTVLVVHKTGDMRPGPGFFELAKKLDRDVSEIDRCWVEEFKRVRRAYAP
jgi:hypothetical protein